MKKKKCIRWILWTAVILPVIVIALYYFDLGAIQTRRQIRQYEVSQPYQRLEMLRNSEEEIFFQYDNGGRIYYSGGRNAGDDGWLWKYGAIQPDGSRVITMELQYSAPQDPPSDWIERMMVPDAQGTLRCAAQTAYKNGIQVSHTTFAYNAQGQITYIRTEYADPTKTAVTLEYQWNKNGDMTGSVEENADGRKEITYGRNVYGDVDRIHWTHTDPDGTQTEGRRVYLWRYIWRGKLTYIQPRSKEEWVKKAMCLYGADNPMEMIFYSEEKTSPLDSVTCRHVVPAQDPQLLNQYPWLFAHGDPQFTYVKWSQQP
ncbi:MAG: hypothetical protein IJY28_08525 [Clostridia bacterium]|nr:hypothetical protein [Clostridia bacterium]